MIQAVVDSFSLSFNGLQGNDVFEFYEKIIPLVVPAENAGSGSAIPAGYLSYLQETLRCYC